MPLTITESNVVAVAIVLGLLGIVECFFGYRFFRIVLAITGFFVGAGLAVSLIPTDQQALTLLVALVGGIIGAVLFYYLYFIGTFLAGVSLGSTVGAILAANLRLDPTATQFTIIVGAILGGVLGFALAKYIIMLSTAFTGAAQIVYALLLLVPGMRIPQSPNQITLQLAQPQALLVTVVILILAAIGFAYQLRIYRHAPLTTGERLV